MLNGLDLFSGIGGITLGLAPWVKPIAYCEQDRYCQGVLLSRMCEGAQGLKVLESKNSEATMRIRVFKVPSAKSILMVKIRSRFGWEGYGAFLAVWEYAQEWGLTSLDEHILKSILRVNKVGAAKYGPLFNEILPQVMEAMKK